MGGDIHVPLAFTFCFCFEKKGKKGTHEFKLLDNLIGYAFLIQGCVIEPALSPFIHGARYASALV